MLHGNSNKTSSSRDKEKNKNKNKFKWIYEEIEMKRLAENEYVKTENKNRKKIEKHSTIKSRTATSSDFSGTWKVLQCDWQRQRRYQILEHFILHTRAKNQVRWFLESEHELEKKVNTCNKIWNDEAKKM